jgi:hypothetical protein
MGLGFELGGFDLLRRRSCSDATNGFQHAKCSTTMFEEVLQRITTT